MEYPVIVYSLSESEIEIDEYEVLRYLGYRKSAITDNDIRLVQKIIPTVKKVISGRACYCKFPLSCLEENKIKLPYGTVVSKDLTRNLNGCSQVYFFAATIGLGFDRLLQTTRLKSMADAAIMQAIGAAAVEFVCDTLNDKLKCEAESQGFKARPRYSPGFGDFTLENQRGIFDVLNPAKHCGITLKDNLIMAPEKSVTALIGLEKQEDTELK